MGRRVVCIILLLVLVLFSSQAFATTGSEIGDILNSIEESESEEGVGSTTNTNRSSGGLADYLRGYNPVTNESIAEASRVMSPVTAIIGNLIGIIMVLVSSAIFLVTVVDLLAIAVPITRTILVTSVPQQSSIGMGGTANQGRQLRILSDEALQCIAVAEQGGQSSQATPFGGVSNYGGTGYGIGGQSYGLGGGAVGQQQGKPKIKSLVWMYLKSRVFFMVLFTVASLLLTSSILVGTGINIAELLMRLIIKLNEGIAGVM